MQVGERFRRNTGSIGHQMATATFHVYVCVCVCDEFTVCVFGSLCVFVFKGLWFLIGSEAPEIKYTMFNCRLFRWPNKRLRLSRPARQTGRDNDQGMMVQRQTDGERG